MNQLKIWYLGFLILFVVHGIEEYVTGFHTIDPTLQALSLRTGLNVLTIFLFIQIIVLLILLWLIRYQKMLLAFILLLSFLELEHVFRGVIQNKYYPGMLTALGFPIITFFYLKELAQKRRPRR